jgi:hypothetical protein
MAEESKQSKNTLKVVLDSNALFVPLQFKIDIFEELKKLLKVNFETVLLSPIRQELEKFAEKGSPKMRKNAAYALKLAEKCTLIETEQKTGVSTDDVIAEVALKRGFPVFTNDRKLRKKLRNINVPVIYVRQKSQLTIDGRI